MREKLRLQAANDKLYLPEAAKIIRAKKFTDKETFFEIEIASGRSLHHMPGQFVQIFIPGVGEAPISISSPPAKHNRFDLCFRAVGEVTNKMSSLREGDTIYFRGPFGHGFDHQIQNRMLAKHLILIMGGMGYAPLRSLINKIIPERDNYNKISILYGSKSKKDLMYPDELTAIAKIGENVELLVTIDKPEEGWQGNVGVITTLIPKVDFSPNETLAFVVGPPIMYKFVLKSLLERKMPTANIYIDLERRMRCGIGKCGHCQMEGIYVCQEGPVFNYAEAENNEEVF